MGELLKAVVEDRSGNLKSFEKQQQLLVVRSERSNASKWFGA
jgi:hypothetical protein